ncbi:MAG: dephospho-CoA kinase [Bacteroidales bacterium]|nr:dephospho-CoA kinase [Bacteroidales bacterium]
MIKVGLTGGIGSGKTTVCKVFRQLGIPVYHADIQARMLSDADPDIRKALTGLCGKNIYTQSGLDRKRLSEVIFSNIDLLQKVNAIIHPRVIEDFNQWMTENHEDRYIIHEAAILFESGLNTLFNKIITVVAPEEIRIRRIMEREGVSEDYVRNIIRNQWPEKKKKSLSDYIIINDQKKLVLPQVLKIHNELIFLSRE